MPTVYIIAEAGVNHNGDINIAKRLIDAAEEAGADAVKFQCFKPDKLVSGFADKAGYQKETTNRYEKQLDMVRRLELSSKQQLELFNYCKEKRFQFLSSPFDEISLSFLNEIGMEIYKIPSGEITNLPLLEKTGKLKKKVILSSGMSTLGEIEEALRILRAFGTNDITVLHCNTEYPTPIKDVNLYAMNTIREAFQVKVGYSDHTLGIEVPVAAVALGAIVIEKHFTLDRRMEGPDHKASLLPDELKTMIQAIRNVEVALGNGIKKPSPSEKNNIYNVRKSVVAGRSIKKGEKFSEDNITAKRPGNGISPMRWYEIIGRKADKDYQEDELIRI